MGKNTLFKYSPSSLMWVCQIVLNLNSFLLKFFGIYTGVVHRCYIHIVVFAKAGAFSFNI
jgi:hypothetical protein